MIVLAFYSKMNSIIYLLDENLTILPENCINSIAVKNLILNNSN